jgi:heme/copper-type cytochrome/quinol oxidase subunit 2
MLSNTYMNSIFVTAISKLTMLYLENAYRLKKLEEKEVTEENQTLGLLRTKIKIVNWLILAWFSWSTLTPKACKDLQDHSTIWRLRLLCKRKTHI